MRSSGKSSAAGGKWKPVALRFLHPAIAAWASMLLGASAGVAQDIHFSQFFNVPMGLNPGCIGQFDGDYRAHGVFRQQWRSVTVPYRTFGLGGVDLPIDLGLLLGGARGILVAQRHQHGGPDRQRRYCIAGSRVRCDIAERVLGAVQQP